MTQKIKHIPLDERVKSTVRAVVLARMSDPNAKDVSMESQVEACEAFIDKMCWPRPTLGPFKDKASGYYHVERPALDEVERLIVKREVDVVVVLNYKRLARDDIRRKAALYTARKYGVEYRFAEIEPDGKLPETIEGQVLDAILGLVGEIEREAIIANLARGKAKRVALGYPTGGRGGPPYGFRKARPEDTTTYWAEETHEADTLRHMFSWLTQMDETRDPEASARGVVRELARIGSRTREGYRWSTTTVLSKLRNPLYCGRGQLNRWQVVREDRTDELTGEVWNTKTLKPRAETFPIAEGMIPTLVDPQLFDRVQAILEQPNPSSGRLGREQNGHPEDATFLHSGFIRCAMCGRAMTRYWRPATPGRPNGIAYYRCTADATDPQACYRHVILARKVEDLTLRALARVLSDPEKIIALADAAEQRREEAEYTVIKTTTDMEAMETLIAQTDTQIANTLDAVAALSKVPGMEETVADLRAKILGLSASRERATAERLRLTPQRERASERAAFLRSLFSQRDKLDEWLPMESAGALLGETPPKLDGTVIDLGEAGWVEDPATDSWPGEAYRSEDDEHSVAKTDYVVYALLRRTPHQYLRKLLRELEVVVKVKPPRTPAERAEHGTTPVYERVTVAIGDLEIAGRALVQTTEQSCTADNKNLTTFDEETYVVEGLRAGARGYVLKDVSAAQLLDAIRAVQRGESPLQPSVAAKLVAHLNRRPELESSMPSSGAGSGAAGGLLVDDLTEREYEILRYVARGESNREIGEALYITEGTVKNHVSNILSKLGLRDRTQAALWAREHGLV